MASLYPATTCRIYGLCDPRTSELRYVGRTFRSLSHRLNQHIQEARIPSKKTHCNRWVRKLLGGDITPEIFLIEEVAGEEWREAEGFAIAYFRFLGCDLCNQQHGGLGPTSHSEETRRKISQS